MTIGRTAWMVSIILGLIFLAFYQSVKKQRHYIRNGLLLVLCVCMMFPVTFGMTRYLPPVFHHPVWFWGEWNEERVHSWDAWDSEKYVNLEELVETAVGRTTEITDGLFGKSPFAIKAYAEELLSQEERLRENAVLKTEEEYMNPFVVRKTIYSHYFADLNLLGHTQADQGFQLTYFYWIGHAHNIYLQYATDFGVPAALCLLILSAVSIIKTITAFYRKKVPVRSACSIFMMLVPLLFGILEYSWGSNAITMILLFLCWRQTLVYEK